jgi:hypothetical protein
MEQELPTLTGRTDNTMDKRTRPKGQTTICKTLHKKTPQQLKIE